MGNITLTLDTVNKSAKVSGNGNVSAKVSGNKVSVYTRNSSENDYQTTNFDSTNTKASKKSGTSFFKKEISEIKDRISNLKESISKLTAAIKAQNAAKTTYNNGINLQSQTGLSAYEKASNGAGLSLNSGSSAFTSGSQSKIESLMNSSMFSNGVLKGKGAFIYQCCKKYGVNPYLVIAIMSLETGYGTSNAIRTKNNPGGYMDPKTGCSTLKHFSSLDEGIEAVIRNLAKNYTSQGLNTIAKIGAKYCPVGAQNDPKGMNSGWIPSVTKIFNKITGNNISANTKIA